MKTINRNNYEEFFLLFIDDELNAADRLAVENFVEQNPDLAIEFQLLQQSKVIPDRISFTYKETLLRTEGNDINETNYEEFFLLYIDNELSAAKREEVEKFVLQHPKLQDSFTTLKKAVLTPENISYGNKENLYRTEKRRTVYLKTWQWVAAAMVVGICATGIWKWQNASSKIPVTANHQQEQQPTNALIIREPVDSSHQVIQNVQDIAAQQENDQPVQKEQQKNFIKKEKNSRLEVAAVKKKAGADSMKVAVNINKQQPAKVEQQPAQDVMAMNKIEPPSPLDKIADGHIKSQQQNDVAALQNSMHDEQTENNYAVYPVAYKEINTNDEDRSLRIGVFDLNKDKVKNLFKKAGRMFGNKKNNPDREGKLQVAGFEIETNQ